MAAARPTDQDELSPPSQDTDAAKPDGQELSLSEQWESEGAEKREYVLSRDARLRLDKYVQNRIKGFSRHQVQKLIDLECVTVNGKASKASHKLKQGDHVEIVLPPRAPSDLPPDDIPLHILFEDDDMVVVNKQADLIVHPARSFSRGTMLNALVHHFQQSAAAKAPEPSAEHDVSEAASSSAGLSDVGKGDLRPGVVHRLDKNTTGVIVVAKRDETHWMLAKQFENRTNLKAYLALVHGCPDPPGGAIDQPLGKHPTIREAHAVRHDSSGKQSLTLYRVRERYEGYSLVELELKTGRTHQIRVHLSHLGFPIVGDLIYGGEVVGDAEIDTPPHPAAGRPLVNYARDKAEGQKLESAALERVNTGELVMHTPALHAALLGIKHPLSSERMVFTAPAHEPMAALIRKLRERRAEGAVVSEGWHVDV